VRRHRHHLYSCAVRQFLRALWKVDLALTIAVAIALCVLYPLRATPTNMNNSGPNDGTAAQANLQTALPGAQMYYRSNHDSFIGIDGGPQLSAGVSSIAEISFGLTFVGGHQSSTAPNVVSIVAPSPSVLIMTAYNNRAQICWGLLTVAHTRARPYFQAFPTTAAVGTYYLKGVSSDCVAATMVPTALSRNGWPRT
jgi:hypothetical protein